MRVLFVQKEGGIFGAENYHLHIIPALKEVGIAIDFLRLYTNYQGGKGGAFVNKLHAMNVPVHEINIGRFPSFSKVRKVSHILTKGNYDLVHTHLIHADFYLSLVKKIHGLNCKWLSTKHGYDNSFTAKYGFNAKKQGITLYYLLVRWSEQLVDKSYTISHGLRNFFMATGITQEGKMDMIHYGFDFQEMKEENLNPELRVFEKQIIIAGRLVRFKGHIFLIQAMKFLVQEFPQVGLVIVGTGVLEDELKILVKNLQLERNIHFVGYSNEVSKWMFNSDVVAVPSISEGFGVVFLEAFNSQKPVVAFDVPAANEHIDHAVTGYLVKPYDIRALAEALQLALEKNSKNEGIVNVAFNSLKEYYNLKRMTQETLAIYQKTLAD